MSLFSGVKEVAKDTREDASAPETRVAAESIRIALGSSVTASRFPPSPATGVEKAGTIHVDRAVGRFELTFGISRYMWLCGYHRKVREDAGWTVKRLGDVDQECDDCRHAVQPDTSGMAFSPPLRVTSEGTESPHEQEIGT